MASEETPKIWFDLDVEVEGGVQAGEGGGARDGDRISPQLVPPGLLNLNLGLLASLTIGLGNNERLEVGADRAAG